MPGSGPNACSIKDSPASFPVVIHPVVRPSVQCTLKRDWTQKKKKGDAIERNGGGEFCQIRKPIKRLEGNCVVRISPLLVFFSFLTTTLEHGMLVLFPQRPRKPLLSFACCASGRPSLGAIHKGHPHREGEGVAPKQT